MLRWIILTQAVVYLLVMPALRAQGEAGYHPPILIGLIGVAALFAGVMLHRPQPAIQTQPTRSSLAPRGQLWIGIVALAVLYSLVSLQFGLLNRRQGSEMMAEIFGTMPFWAMIIIRGYELLLPLLIILYALA